MYWPWFQFTLLNSCYSKLHYPFSFEYVCFLHLLLTWYYKCLQNKYSQLCLRHVKKVMCKVQEVSSGFWLSKYQLRIITKLEATFKSPSSINPWFYVSVMALHHWQLNSAAAFIPLNSLVSLSILLLSLHKDPLPKCLYLLHTYFSHQLQHFAGIISWVLHQGCLASPAAAIQAGIPLKAVSLQLHHFRAGRDSARSQIPHVQRGR